MRVAALLLPALMLGACSTPEPPSGVSTRAGIKYDGDKQDAGIEVIGGKITVSQGYRAQYLEWLPKYGSQARAPKNPFTLNEVPGQYPYFITPEGAQAFEAMDRADAPARIPIK